MWIWKILKSNCVFHSTETAIIRYTLNSNIDNGSNKDIGNVFPAINIQFPSAFCVERMSMTDRSIWIFSEWYTDHFHIILFLNIKRIFPSWTHRSSIIAFQLTIDQTQFIHIRSPQFFIQNNKKEAEWTGRFFPKDSIAEHKH